MKVSDVMVTNFQTASKGKAGTPATTGTTGTELVVLTGPDGQPVSILSPGQSASDSLPVPVVVEDAGLDETVLALTPQFLDRKELAGAVVLRGSKILGVLPRGVIAEHALQLLNQSRSLPGDPQLERPIYACPRGDYQKPVSYYNPSDPPRCPIHGDPLVRKV